MSRTLENWQNLPHFIFGDIMTMLGRESLQDFQKCRHVCLNWNVMLSQMTKCDKATIIRPAESLAAKIREKLAIINKARLPEITTAASLAHNGLLGSVEEMVLLSTWPPWPPV